jgi:transcriptional regulator with PAS, ATPase and Fis domain
MKDIRFNIRLNVIIPIIFTGIALLSTIVSYHITVFYLKKGMNPVWPVSFWGTVMMVITFICGLLIVKFIIDPMERFASSAERLGVLQNISKEKKETAKDDIGRYTLLFDQVTELLSKVEARTLFPQIVGQSKAMRGVFNQIIKVAATDSTVLILGETGTGKELISQSIFKHSQRQDQPFVAINCAAIPENLLESELFGHEKGAFTGANAKKPGKFEVANNGTIFLDEIGDMPLETQAKVLRVIEEGQVERVGGLRPIKVNVRFIAATNKDLPKMVEAGKFRQDLFFRLNVFRIHLPPLRERREDIPLLVDQFLKQLERKVDISSQAMQYFTAYGWPGNVRELKNAVEAASVLAQDIIEPKHLPFSVTGDRRNTKREELEMPKNQNLDNRLKEVEKGIIIEALARAGGVQVNAAKILGIKERSLWHRIKKFDIDATAFKRDFEKNVQ